jgi:hypothetical protein
MNSDDRVAAANRLGGLVTYDHPVPPRRDRFGSPWCPVCSYGLQDPHFIDTPFVLHTNDGKQTQIENMMMFTGACPECKQVLDWHGWPKQISDAEYDEHTKSGCGPARCFRCRARHER